MTRFSLATTLFIVLMCQSIAAAACDNCQRPQVVAFDCKVIPPRPSDTTDPQLAQKIIAWRDLFWAAAGIKTYIFNSDATRDCFTHLDGSFFTQGDTISKGIKFGEEWSNLPPAKGSAGGDYLVTGSVDGVVGAYTVTAELKVSKTGASVASASVNFTESIGSIDAGKSAAQAMGPVLDKIRAFEKMKRATGHPYALQPTAELHPVKSVVNKNEAVEVELWLYDCDGDINTSPLANRPVQITATGGTVSPQSVTTGNDGKVKFTFTAGNTPTEALLQAIYPFKLASEYESSNHGGNAAIKITAVPSTLWRVSGTLHKSTEYDEIQSSTITGYTGGSQQYSQTQDEFRLSAVIRNVAKDSLTVFKSDTTPLSLNITGLHSENERNNGYGIYTKVWTKDMSYQTTSCIPVKSAESAEDVFFSFFYEPYTNRQESKRTFSISGWDMKGISYTKSQSCNSEEGCTDESNESEASDLIEVYIGGIENDSGISKDTTYIDALSGDHWTTKTRKWIKKVEDSYLLHSYYSQTVVSTLAGGAHTTHSTSKSERMYDFIIQPIDKQPSAVERKASSPILAKDLNAKIRLSQNVLNVKYSAPENGNLQLKLYDLQGRLIHSNTFTAVLGNQVAQSILPKVMPCGVWCADLSFKTESGKRITQQLLVKHVTNSN
ncbi:MAG: Ig-like domain-containing protein [Fibrobacteres bacterium]|nr:Ig-like domain-containing protein [Fibrobacterota bacterium]